jgi:hypothetical protein
LKKTCDWTCDDEEEAKSFFDEMKISDKCTICDGWLQNFKEFRGIGKMDVSGQVVSPAVETAELYRIIVYNFAVVTSCGTA